MARSPDIIVDRTPLTSPTIDVPLRIGWLLRTCRLNSPKTTGMAGNAFAREIGVNPAQVTKWEKATDDVDTLGLEGYEQAVGMAPGSLRGVVEMTRRSFRYRARSRPLPPRLPDDLDQLNLLLWPAMHGEPTGIDWLNFADALNAEGPLALPGFTAEPVIDRLASELARSVDSAFLTRYEAMARLRTGRYRTVALKSLLGCALAEDAQVAAELLIVAGELPSPQLFTDMCRLLVDPRRPVFVGACHALSNMAALGGLNLREMGEAVPRLVQAYNAVCRDARRHQLMSNLVRGLPRGVVSAVREGIERPLAPVPQRTESVRDSPTYAAAQAAADRIKRDLPSPEDELLERVLFEALHDPVWVKRYVAKYFLMSLPYKDRIVEEVTFLADDHALPDVRRGAAELLMNIGSMTGVDTAVRWVESGDPRERHLGLAALGNFGHDLDTSLLEKVSGLDWDTAQRALYAAGMTGSPVLLEWADDPSRSDAFRAGARWWLRHGSRITR